jgi:hypothetical protein
MRIAILGRADYLLLQERIKQLAALNQEIHLITNPFAKSGIEDKNRLRVNSTERGHRVKQLSN